MSDLVTFLLARLAEDEVEPRRWVKWNEYKLDTLLDRALAVHFARRDPVRVLREIEVKRQIVETFAVGDMINRRDDEGAAVRMVLRLFALPYAGHPAYRAGWLL